MRRIKKIGDKEWAAREEAGAIKKRWVRLTRACNNRCLFCHDKEAQNGTVIPFKKIREELLEGKKGGATRAVLSGGDPTLHPKLMDIIAYAKSIGYGHVQLITNGRMFAYESFLNKSISSGLDEVTFSIHGHTETLHDGLTGIPGSFRQAMDGLKNVLERKTLIVSIDIVINKKNVKFLERILRFFIALGVREFDLLQVMPFGRAWENRGGILYDTNRMMPSLGKAFELSLAPGLFIWANRFPPASLRGFRHLIQPSLKMFDEIKGREDIFSAFLRRGRKIDCFGQRCGFCFLEDFCSDLHAYKAQGFLEPKKWPGCLKCAGDGKQECLNNSRDPDLYTFFEFFRQNRYFVKIAACRTCRKRKGCEGMPVDRARCQKK